jgi:hypothetical protein
MIFIWWVIGVLAVLLTPVIFFGFNSGISNSPDSLLSVVLILFLASPTAFAGAFLGTSCIRSLKKKLGSWNRNDFTSWAGLIISIFLVITFSYVFILMVLV